MAIEKKLSAWVEAGLLSQEQAAAIAAFEGQGGRNWVLLGFGAVGVVAVATGVVSLVAANWDDIPAGAKLVGYFLLQAALGAAFLRVRERDGLAREALLSLFGLAFLAGIGLVGQVYNLESEGWPALLFWCALALPAALLARSRLLPHLWLAGLALALLIWTWSPPHQDDLVFARALTAMGVAFLLTAVGLFRHPRTPLPEPFRRAALFWGFGALAASSVVASVWWAAEVTGEPGLASLFPWAGALLAGITVYASRPAAPPIARGAALVAFLILAVSATVPLVAPIEPHEILGCVLFLTIWTLAAVAAGIAGRRRLFDFATFAIATRLVVVYFEVFGSLSATGVGLIVSGLLILGVAYAWHRYRSRLAVWLGEALMKGTLKAWLAVLVPVVVMLGWTGYHAAVAARGEKIRLRVEGYDPRDLLSGHYLRYRVDYGLDACADHGQPAPCVCLERPGGGAPARATWAGGCEARPDCRLWLRGSCSASRFEAGIERFYFPETLARPLAVVPPDATIEVALDGRGGGVVTGFFVGDEPLLDYARRQ